MNALCYDKFRSCGGRPRWPELSVAAVMKPLTDEEQQLLPVNRTEPQSEDQKSTATVSQGWRLPIWLADTVFSRS